MDQVKYSVTDFEKILTIQLYVLNAREHPFVLELGIISAFKFRLVFLLNILYVIAIAEAFYNLKDITNHTITQI